MSFLSLRAAALAAALLPTLGAAESLTLQQALDHAVQRSETMRSGRAGVTSAGEMARAAGQLPDPMVGLSLENLPITGPDRLRTTREGMTMKRLAVSQEWVSPEKRSLRTAAADATVAREAAALAVAAADTRLQAALAYVDAYFAAAALRLGTESEDRAREAAEAGRARLATAGTSAPEALELAARRGAAADEAAELRQQARAASIGLARWTGMAAAELHAPALPSQLSEQGFVDLHPLVVARAREVEVARREAAATAANRRPNWTWEVAYGQRTGMSDLVSVGVSVPLPIAPAARQDRETAGRLALVERAEAEQAEAARLARAEYQLLASDAARLQERIAAFEQDVVAVARQRAAAATAAYASNQAGLSMVFEARQAHIEAQRKHLALRREQARVLAQMVYKPVRAEELQ